MSKPKWWPKCPYSEDIWPIPWEEYVKAVPDPKSRLAISHVLMREGWELCEEDIWKSLKDGPIYERLKDILLSEE